MNSVKAAREYFRRGWRVVPVPFGEKGPRLAGWQNLHLALEDLPRHFGCQANVGIILGTASGNLTDLDLDCPEAIALAPLYLPATNATFGRPSKPQSHLLYIAPGATFETFVDPIVDGKNTLLEVRAGAGHQTIFPPSIADDEQRKWYGDVIAPRVVDATSLRLAAAWLAIGCLVMRYVSEHSARRPGPDLPRLLWEWDQPLGRVAYQWLGRLTPDAQQKHLRPRKKLTRGELDLAEMLAAIPNDCDWNGWNRIGLAIYAASGGSPEGGIVFDDWSAKSPKYNPYNTADRWAHYRRSPPTSISAGTLVYLARQNGWAGGRK